MTRQDHPSDGLYFCPKCRAPRKPPGKPFSRICPKCGSHKKALIKFEPSPGIHLYRPYRGTLSAIQSVALSSLTHKVRSGRTQDCPECHLPSIFGSKTILLKLDERVPPCPVCGIRSTPTLVRLLTDRALVSRITKNVDRAIATRKSFKKIVLPGVVILPNGNYFSSYVGMGRR